VYDPSKVSLEMDGKRVSFSLGEDVINSKPKQERLIVSIELKGFGILSGNLELSPESVDVWNQYLKSKESSFD